ncbi:LysR family transcriptional regulator [Gallibacterium genomosp. 3]|uniref:HTH lysR-type domain-containing protein n=1 Tax=Gallibacterium genomosp. 3 TaxID=505345 RepID=A0A1A7Q9A7_9PAST|nr:LysR family transcriptional regulator [Gallibacterium genomosp. 3]OBX09995.1 hypothetical protein QV07_04560 [Gallibacterium genomosp. 3]
MDKLNALKIFCSVADTLQFRETATRLAISPQVISRVISELEEMLGESLFQRSTRQVQLTDFGRQLLPQARLAVQQTEAVFDQASKQHIKMMSGVVRISVPDMPLVDQIFVNLMGKLRNYPDLQIDWRSSMKKANLVEDRIDIGLRFGCKPIDHSLVVKQVAQIHEIFVAAPTLLAQFGTPTTLETLMQFPLAVQVDINTGRIFDWEIEAKQNFQPTQPRIIADSMSALLQMALAGEAIVCLHRSLCHPYLQTGELVEILPNKKRTVWGAYLYRPQRNITHPRIKLVFELLAESVEAVFSQ